MEDLPEKAASSLNSLGLEIRNTEGKGRGVYGIAASRPIPAFTLIEISPVLLFSKEEYAEHGRYTILDHYTFNWRDGRMALALGLGSIFNHSSNPNVSYTLKSAKEAIWYTTTRAIAENEELSIFYGHNLWFDDVTVSSTRQNSMQPETEESEVALPNLGDDYEEAPPQASLNDAWTQLIARYSFGRGDDGVNEEDLPFTRIQTTPMAPPEESPEDVMTVLVWVVDLPDLRMTAPLLKWVQQTSISDDPLAHLKQVRKDLVSGVTSVLLGLAQSDIPPDRTDLPSGRDLPEPRLIPVPARSATTMTSLALKNAFWPTLYTPSRKNEVEVWTKGKLKWACESIRHVCRIAQDAKSAGQLPIAAYIPDPYYSETDGPNPPHDISGIDTRNEAGHPLRHAVLAAIRSLADKRSTPNRETDISTDPEAKNGSNYLLTSLTMFVTHEPCIMCSMALLHSRVKEVVFLQSSPGTGGCGGSVCVPGLEAVNHRYNILRWKIDSDDLWKRWWDDMSLAVDDSIDV